MYNIEEILSLEPALVQDITSTNMIGMIVVIAQTLMIITLAAYHYINRRKL